MSIFFTFNDKIVKHLRGNRKYADLPHVAGPMSVTQCHLVHLHSTTSSTMCVLVNAVIRIPNKQYYICTFSGVLEEYVAKSDLKFPYRFFKTYKFRKHVFIRMLLRVIIK